MTDRMLRDVTNGRFRANPEYELVLFDRLSAEQQNLLAGLRQDPDFYGIFHSRHGSGTSKSASRDLALLYLSLVEPGPLPSYLRAMLGASYNHTIIELVLDGVLQIEVDGRMVSGATAYPALYENAASSPANSNFVAGVEVPESRLGALSIAALQYAQALALPDVNALSLRLYSYGRTPASIGWRQHLPDTTATERHLSLDERGKVRQRLQGNWTPVPPSSPHDSWSAWQTRRPLPLDRSAEGFKLYVSPRPEAIRPALETVAEVLQDSPAHHFKVGRDLYGLLRPDKLVIYFHRFAELQKVAAALEAKLAGCPAHGVPFTAELTTDGLLSWGVDPPAPDYPLPWNSHESWRLWVTNRLAISLASAQAGEPGTIPPWRFALERLRLEGINTQTWTPVHSVTH